MTDGARMRNSVATLIPIRTIEMSRGAMAAVFSVAAFLAGPLTIGDEELAQVPLTKDDVERIPSYTVMPEYPAVARRDRIEGQVQVCFEISRSGRTRRIAVRKSTHRIFEKPAIRAVRASTYVPLPKDAKLSGIKSCRTFRFMLEPVVEETENEPAA